MTTFAPRTKVKRSRYLLVGPQRYRDADGRTVRLAYATRTGRIFPLDETELRCIAEGAFDRLPSERHAELCAAKALAPTDEDEFAAVLSGYRTGSADLSKRQITIMPTSYCNMACSYCGQEHRKSAVNAARVEAVTTRVEKVLADPEVRDLQVTWFGGEPLLGLRVIREISARAVAAAEEHGVRYRANMATNGSLLTARTLDLLHHECRVTSMDVTIDGPAEVHNARRLRRNGRGSFDHTVRVLSAALRDPTLNGLRFRVRMNIDSANEDHVTDLIFDLACLGFASPRVVLDLMPVHSWGNDVSDVELGKARYAAREAGWLRLAHELGIGFGPLPTTPKSTTCLATMRGGELLDSKGRVFACSEHPLVPGVDEVSAVGHVQDLPAARPRPPGAFDDWYDSVAEGESSCHDCPMLPVCGGCCPKLWRDGHIPCPSFRHNWADRLGIVAKTRGLQEMAE